MAVERLLQYFDLQSDRREGTFNMDEGAKLSVLPQYIAVVLGITIQPFLAAYQASNHWNFSLETLTGRSLFALIIGLLVFPGVYRKAFDPGQPLFVQWCAIFSLGIGWQSLLGVAAQAALGIPQTLR